MSEYWLKTFAELAPGHDPRHVMAWVLIERPILSDLTRDQLKTEAATAVACIEEFGMDEAEALAQSYGLRATAHAAGAALRQAQGEVQP